MAERFGERELLLVGAGAFLVLVFNQRRGMGGGQGFPFAPGLPPGPIPIPGPIPGGGAGGGTAGGCSSDNPELCIPWTPPPIAAPCQIDPLIGDCVTVEQFPPSSPLGSNVIPDPSGIVGPRPITSP